jgi:hypothetical protein
MKHSTRGRAILLAELVTTAGDAQSEQLSCRVLSPHRETSFVAANDAVEKDSVETWHIMPREISTKMCSTIDDQRPQQPGFGGAGALYGLKGH